MNVKGDHFTVVGAGRSGLAAANALAALGGDVRLVDGADKPRPDALDDRAEYRGGTNAVRPGDIAVLSPGIPEVSPVRQEVAAVAREVIGEVELFARLCPAPIVAITGTDGKSTTTTMIGAIHDASGRPTFVGGNLGNPLTEAVGKLSAEHIVVAEVSAFQLTTCDRFHPVVAVVTNISEDHLDYHGGYAPYQSAKQRVYASMGEGDVVILNRDDDQISRWSLPEGPTLRWFSIDGADADATYRDGVLYLGSRPLMTRGELPLLGRHNVANALAAALAAEASGVSDAVIKRGLMGYAPLPHRLETVATLDGVRWVNDSKATNPNAAAAGIRAIESPLILLAGGSSKDADFSEIGALMRAHTRHAILFGQTRDQLAEAIGEGHPVTRVETMDEAVALAADMAEDGDTVLLGPACASYDQFRSYEHRGQVFCSLVDGLRA